MSTGRLRSRERQPADTAAVRQECSGDTYASMTTVREDGVAVVLDIAGIAPSALDAASASAVAASTPDAGVGSGAGSGTTLVIAECLHCKGNHHHPHTCGKRRARPQAAEAPARASRRRGQAAETADPGAALAARAGADDVTAGERAFKMSTSNKLDADRVSTVEIIDTTGRQEGTVPHRDRPAHIPWSVGEHKGVCIMLVCKQDSVSLCPRFTPSTANKMLKK